MKREIVLITNTLSRSRGGAEIHMANLAEFFARHGHRVRAYVRKSSPEFAVEGVAVEVLPVLPSGGILGECQFARAVRARTREDPILFSILPLPGVTHYIPITGLLADSFAATRDSMEPGLRRTFYRFGNRLNLKRRWMMTMQQRLLGRESLPRIATFSETLRARILSKHPMPASNLTVIPLGVPLDHFSPRAQRQAGDGGKTLRLLFVGHNFRLKGLHCAFQALALAKAQGLRAELRVVGNGARAEFQKIASDLGLASDVHFAGFINESRMPALYHDSDALIHPTFTDHSSLNVLEALACGLPVITTRQNGAAEVMESEKNGFVVDHPRDIEALRDALLFLRDPQKRAAMREGALALRPKIDFDVHARRVLAWLMEET